MIFNFSKNISIPLLLSILTAAVLWLSFYGNTQPGTGTKITINTTHHFHIAVSANFRSTLEVLIKDYKRQFPNINITFSSGSSGSLYQQILHGAPYQLFLSADTRYPKQLEQQHKAIAGSRRTYALGELVLWSPKQYLNSIQQLTNSSILALANPKTAPYGRAASEVLTHLSRPNLKQVQGHSISQAHQFVASGNADVGLLARSQVIQDIQHVTTIDPNLYQPIKQQMVLLSKNNIAAKDFFHYLISEQAQAIIQASGYKSLKTLPQITFKKTRHQSISSVLISPQEVSIVTHAQ